MASEKSLYEEGLERFKIAVQKDRIRDERELDDLEGFLRESKSAEHALECSRSIKTDASRKWGGRTKVDEKWLGRIMGNIQNFITVGDFVMKKAPESVGAAWFGVSLALSAIQSNYALYSLFGSGLSEITEMMVTIKHYDYLYHQKRKPGTKPSDNTTKFFNEIADTYVAMLDFSFSVHRHLSGSGWAKVRHGIKDFFKENEHKFQGKIDKMSSQKKKVLEISQGAFQEEALTQFDDVQGTLSLVQTNIEDIKRFQQESEQLHREQLEMQEEWRKTMNDVKEVMKPRTPWDFALQKFNEIKKVLKPLEKTADPLFESLDEKHEGTCKWLLENDVYKSWLDSTGARMVCVKGQAGVGKSALLASVFTTIDDEMDDDVGIVLYFSCELPNSGGENSSRTFAGLSNTLIYQLYELATHDETNLSRLENCNKVFSNPKGRKSAKTTRTTTKERKQDESLPSLAEALSKLSYHLGKKLVVVIDAPDRLPADDQRQLLEAIQEVANIDASGEEANAHIQILTACRPDASFCNDWSHGTVIDMEANNRDDIQLKLNDELIAMHTWSKQQRDEIVQAVLDKAGSKFDYITKVALPFLREPFQGPLSERLEQLPEGIGETYAQALRTMKPNYLELLKCALSWTLFSPGPVKVIEIMDSFRGVFIDDTGETAWTEEASWTRDATAQEVDQVKQAAGPFLDVWANDNGEWVVELKDITQVQRFFLEHSHSDSRPRTPDCEAPCVHCKVKESNTMGSLSFSRKEGHLELAIKCIQHMCNDALWRRYYPMESEEVREGESDGSASEADAEEEAEDDAGNKADENEEEVADEPATTHTNGEPVQEDVHDAQENGETAEGDNEVSEKASVTGDDSGYDSDESMDDEDRGGFSFRNTTGQTSDDLEDYSQQNSDRNIRYEMAYWNFHLQEAEALWTSEEKKDSPQWARLMAELDRLAFEKPISFARLQRIFFIREDIDADVFGSAWTRDAWQPLHVASYLGMISWAQHLINERSQSLETQCDNRTPLHAASRGTADTKMLQLLLENGADPNFQTEKRMPACYSWIWNNPPREDMELFKKHGAKFGDIDLYNCWSALHYFADAGTSLEVLDILLEEDNSGQKPNINAKDDLGETPLHVLLHRREVPQDLLKTFLERGAAVNAEDNSSERPLQEACKWADEEIVRILLPHVEDIDDGDNHGRTALHQAGWDGSIKCVELLLEKGADAMRADFHERTPFFFACLGSLMGTSRETAMLILKHLQTKGISANDINKSTKRGRTPLRQAAARGYHEILAELLKISHAEGDEVTKQTLNRADTLKKRTALHCAAFRGQAESVRLLLESHADVTLKDKEDQTALELAYSQWNLSALKEYEDIIGLLIDADTKAALADAELASTAAANGSKSLLEKLHTLGARLDRPDQYGWTPLMLTRRFGHSEAEEFLNKAFLTRRDKLPSRWINVPAHVKLSDDGLGLEFINDEFQTTCISTNIPIAAELTKFYFEITVGKGEDSDLENPWVAIGLCTLGAAAINYPGWAPADRAPTARSWGYHGDDGGMGSSKGDHASDDNRAYGPGDTVGCGVDFDSGTIWFTRNGVKVDGKFSEDVKGRLFPIVGMAQCAKVDTNFGAQPFKWKGDGKTVNGEDLANGVGHEQESAKEAEEEQTNAGASRSEYVPEAATE